MQTIELARSVGPSRVDLAYHCRGHHTDPAVLLIMGVAGQLIHWPHGFLDALVARHRFVVCFDNRDSGCSTHMNGAPMPDLAAALAGDLSSASYTLADMASDAVGLLDALGIGAAHIVGASMGGAIAQMIAIDHPERTLSLTSMMATTGAPVVGAVHAETLAALFSGPPVMSREQGIDLALRASSLIGSPAFPADREAVAERAGRAWDRDHDVVATTRQAVATIATGDRTDRLRCVRGPALVIHGRADRMCDMSGGVATAEAIAGARLLLIDGMGHDLPSALWDQFADEIAALGADMP